MTEIRSDIGANTRAPDRAAALVAIGLFVGAVPA